VFARSALAHLSRRLVGLLAVGWRGSTLLGAALLVRAPAPTALTTACLELIDVLRCAADVEAIQRSRISPERCASGGRRGSLPRWAAPSSP